MSKPIPVHLGAKAIGEAWLEDSSLERWFPITAEELASLKAERDELRKTLVAMFAEFNGYTNDSAGGKAPPCLKRTAEILSKSKP